MTNEIVKNGIISLVNKINWDKHLLILLYPMVKKSDLTNSHPLFSISNQSYINNIYYMLIQFYNILVINISWKWVGKFLCHVLWLYIFIDLLISWWNIYSLRPLLCASVFHFGMFHINSLTSVLLFLFMDLTFYQLISTHSTQLFQFIFIYISWILCQVKVGHILKNRERYKLDK